MCFITIHQGKKKKRKWTTLEGKSEIYHINFEYNEKQTETLPLLSNWEVIIFFSSLLLVEGVTVTFLTELSDTSSLFSSILPSAICEFECSSTICSFDLNDTADSSTEISTIRMEIAMITSKIIY